VLPTNSEPEQVDVLIQRLDPGLPLPARAHPGDAGADLFAAADTELAPGQRAVVPTGVAIALPDGYEAQIRPRSGLAAKHGITCLNSPGTIDADYRGEVKVILINHGPEAFVIRRGERIAPSRHGRRSSRPRCASGLSATPSSSAARRSACGR